MPYYDYVCSDCNSKFEIKRCISQIDDPAACPECHSEHVSRQVSKVAAFSHGSGGDVSSLGGGGGGCGCGSCGGGTCGSCGSSRN
jgi:putative FmdB family regulatory protein